MPATMESTNSRRPPFSCPAFRLVRPLGQGGMGEVYLAEHRRTRTRCALKVIRADKRDDRLAIKRFRAEIRALKSLQHAHIVRYLGTGRMDDGRIYYAMEYLTGTNLDQCVNEAGPLSPRQVVDLMRQLCAALASVHETGYVHGDIKPANLMAAIADDDTAAVKLVDFGLAAPMAAADADLGDTVSGGFVGSPLYAPPESTFGQRDARSDIYSLGATAYHLLVGRPVFDVGDPVRAVYAHAVEAPITISELRADVSPALNAILMKCLNKNPDERFQTVAELRTALAAVA
jgi:serine/threonine protein kinase